MPTTDNKRPQFKTPPLRRPGDSTREMSRRKLAHEFTWVFIGIAFIAAVVGLNTGLQFGGSLGIRLGSAASLIIALAAIALVLGAGWWLNRRLDFFIAEMDNAAFGIDGERVVGDALDALERMGGGFRVFHDVPPEREPREGEALANFDHIVIGPTGVFVIETKARSRKDRGDNTIVVTADGRVLVNGFEPDRCPIRQAAALRDAMKGMLERQTSLKDIFVRGVVMFPEWHITDKAYRDAGGDIWTLTHTAFPKWLTNGRDPVRLSANDIALLASRIEDHVRKVA